MKFSLNKKTGSPSEQAVMRALSQLPAPGEKEDIVSAGLLSDIQLQEGVASFIITLNEQQSRHADAVQQAAEEAVMRVRGIKKVNAILTSHQSPTSINSPVPEAAPRRMAEWTREPVEGVKRIILVGSGKGGVGKSTTAVNFAVALKKAGMKAGLLDADIYGPSLPRMLGLYEHGQPEIVDGKMIAPRAFGQIPVISLGFILGGEAAVMRGPMITKTLTQLLRGTQWGELDYLIVDLPPGTGDVQLNLAQKTAIHGAIIVTTPQEVAVEDARKAISMLGKVGVPVLGVVENMSGEIFGQGGGKKLAAESKAPLLAEIPLEAMIREAADQGREFSSPHYEAIAAAIIKT